MVLGRFDLIKGTGTSTLRVYTDSGSTPPVNSIVVVPQSGGSSKALIGLLDSEVAVGVIGCDCVNPAVIVQSSDSKHAHVRVLVTRDYTEFLAEPGKTLKIEAISSNGITIRA